MIEKAKDLNPINREILLAYLHFLHMQERLTFARQWDWAYKNIQAHWVRAEYQAHYIR